MRPRHHLQLGSLSDGRPWIAGWTDAIRRRQSDRLGNGACCRNTYTSIMVMLCTEGRITSDDQANEILPVVENTGVLAGVCGTDPFRSMPDFLRQLKSLGFCGVQNFPTVGLIDGKFRQNLEETGMGYDKEVEMIRAAHELDLLTTPYVFNVDEAERMTRAGADVLVCHVGLTTSGSIGAKTALSLDDCVKIVQDIRDAAVKINPDIIVLCHGGPIAEPKDAEYVLSRTKGVHGFFGASSMERLPVEVAIKENAQAFKNLKINK